MSPRIIVLAAVLAGCLAAATASQAADRPLSYVVLKEGEPIGRETVAIHQDGDHTTVQVQTETRVKVLFLDFHYHHQRTETWVGDRLDHLVAETDDDGTPHHIEAWSQGSTTRLTVDGADKDLSGAALPLTLWGEAILDRSMVYSVVDATPYRVSISPLGSETLTVGGRRIETEHYRMSGEVDRELWYGKDGYLVKVAFERRGYPIEFVRE